ncbi:hypothetical protein EYZ11_011358 [Aspergillus tanneri]|uniref:Uncharacterized protein n=1 Tax=Aspergillus tanneri TaxID=1220188 RepID=A0A4S3J549_9EURO|nr:hypothetical protein EYZ11_011358 [Aspergillus tanneri]
MNENCIVPPQLSRDIYGSGRNDDFRATRDVLPLDRSVFDGHASGQPAGG